MRLVNTDFSINSPCHTVQCNRATLWPLTPKIDTATCAFLELSDLRHGQMGVK